MKITYNKTEIAKLKKAIADSFANVVAQMDAEYTKVIESDTEFADLGFSGQDIVDTGRFRDSQIVNSRTVGGVTVVEWSWNPQDPDTGYHYAAALYSGFNAYGKKWIPGRPWTERAIANVDPFQLFIDGIKIS